MAHKIEIYTTSACPYCQRAKRLLDTKGVAYIEIDISSASELREHMKQRTGGRQSVPQIFIDERHIGGCDELYTLNAEGRLDQLLQGVAS